MSQENVEVLRQCFELLAREGSGAFDRILDEYCHPEVEGRGVGRLPDNTSSPHGREAVSAWLGEISAALDVRLEAEEYIDAGESVVVVFRQIARGRESGAELTTRFAFVYGLRNGKIVYMEGFHTKEEALDGVGPPD
jgi:ketosteroid isomerase-like protein